MDRLAHEPLIRLTDARHLFAARTPMRTLREYAHAGIVDATGSRVVLESIKAGKHRLTSAQAVQRFINKLIAAERRASRLAS